MNFILVFSISFFSIFVILTIHHSMLVKKTIKDLKSPFPISRWDAAALLGRIKAISSGKHLVGCLNDDDPYVVKCAIASLGKIRYTRSVPELLKLLDELEGWDRKAIIEALSKMGNRIAIERLHDLRTDRDLWAQEEAEVAIKQIKKSQGIIGKPMFIISKMMLPIIGITAVLFTPKRGNG